jgi:hypothetical protein
MLVEYAPRMIATYISSQMLAREWRKSSISIGIMLIPALSA